MLEERRSRDRMVMTGHEVGPPGLSVELSGKKSSEQMYGRQSVSHGSMPAPPYPPPPPTPTDMSSIQGQPFPAAKRDVQTRVENMSIVHNVLKKAGVTDSVELGELLGYAITVMTRKSMDHNPTVDLNTGHQHQQPQVPPIAPPAQKAKKSSVKKRKDLREKFEHNFTVGLGATIGETTGNTRVVTGQASTW